MTSSLGLADFCEYAHICWNIVTNTQSKALSHFAKSQPTDDEFFKSVVASLDIWKSRASLSPKLREFSEHTFSLSNNLEESAQSMYLFKLHNTALLTTFENIRTNPKTELHSHQQNSWSTEAPPNLETARSVLAHLNTPKNGVFMFENL
jgi:hypothetical protein